MSLDAIEQSVINSLQNSKKAFTLTGYSYIGPGNPLENGEPVDRTDQIAQMHDWAYHTAKSKQDVFDADYKVVAEFTEEVFTHGSPAAL